jgi:AraC family transcriptional regulator, transcriptional activator FtrA
MPKSRHRTEPSPNRRVVALAYDGLCTFEFGIAVEVFGLDRPEMGADWYSFAVASLDGDTLRASGGIRIVVNGGLELLSKAGTIIIPGWKGTEVQVPSVLISALRRAHAGGARIVSICSGAVVLAAAGLLEGRRATTHWRYIEAFATRFPDVRVESDVLYVDEGTILTSAGSAAGIDLCLHLVRQDFGVAAANKVARRLVLPAHREGGQAQFVEQPVLSVQEGARLSPLIEKWRTRLKEALRIARMAREAGMSTRTFVRRFEGATGLPPGQWIARERVSKACALLETSSAPVKSVAESCGFASEATLRHHFRKLRGLSPAAYRAKFGKPEGRNLA